METVLLDGKVRLIQANALSIPLEDESVNCCVTSPPYWGLRDYLGAGDQLGLEKTPEEYVAKMVQVFREVKRVLRNDGTLWLNVGDTYAANRGYQVPQTKDAGTKRDNDAFNNMGMRASDIGLKIKDLVGIPWMLAFALRTDGWYLRQDIIWNKPNTMPESVRDRCTKAHEYIFLLSKSPKYYFDNEAIKEPCVGDPDPASSRNRWDTKDYVVPGQTQQKRTSRNVEGLSREKDGPRVTGNLVGRDDGGRACNKPGQVLRNKRDVWTVATRPYPGSHFATFPPDLIEPCILAGCPFNGIVLDPFGGSGTTGRVAVDNGRRAVLLDINYKDEPDSYLWLANERILAPARKKKEAVPREINEEWPSLLEVTA